MQLIIVAVLAIVASVSCEYEPEKIIRSEFSQDPEGSYNFQYETAGGIVREETGVPKQVLDEKNEPHTVIITKGSYSYKDTEGKVESVYYEADENGFKAVGDSIPKSP